MSSKFNPEGFPVMRDLTIKQIGDYLEQGGKSILLPIGVIEQHGYHLPLSTDALIAEELGKRIAKQAGIIMGPTMYQSFSGGGCPGTINITPATMAHVVSDTLISLASQGFRHFHLFLCHGGSENARALNDTLRINLRLNPIFKDALITLIGIWDCDPNKIGWQKSYREVSSHPACQSPSR